jgi:hypothetical protein
MKFDFRIDASGPRRELGGMAERAMDTLPPFTVIAQELAAARAANAASDGAYYGQPWAGLAQSTRERKSRQGLSGEVMHETGELRAALEGGAGSFERVYPTGVAVGVGGLFYARFQHALRPIVGVRPEDEAAAVVLIHEWIERGVT